MTLSFSLLLSSCFFYLLAFGFHLLSFFGLQAKGDRPAFTLMRVGFLLSTFYFISRSVDDGYFLPVTGFSPATAFFAWALAFVYLVLLVRIQIASFGLVLAPILAALAASALITFSPSAPARADWAALLSNPYFKVHILSAFFAYAAFAISFAAALLYLFQHHELKTRHAGTFYHKLPSLEELERLIYQPLFWGVPLLAVALVVGFLWSKSVFGEYRPSDPKTIATAATLFLYLLLLVSRRFSLRGRRAALLSLFAFGFVMLTFVGTRFIHGSHAYFQ